MRHAQISVPVEGPLSSLRRIASEATTEGCPSITTRPDAAVPVVRRRNRASFGWLQVVLPVRIKIDRFGVDDLAPCVHKHHQVDVQRPQRAVADVGVDKFLITVAGELVGVVPL
jgi:hypothetical protein